MWFLGAMTDDTKRSFDVKLSFLEPDTPYQVQVYRDGINADKNAIDYSFEIKQLDSNSTINIPMASGGGYSAIFKKN